MKFTVRFGYRPHRGGLDESMKERKYISEIEFNKLLPNYEYYANDQRVNQMLFILRDMKHDYKKYPTWLFLEYEE